MTTSFGAGVIEISAGVIEISAGVIEISARKKTPPAAMRTVDHR